jgi:hypothetical protein
VLYSKKGVEWKLRTDIILDDLWYLDREAMMLAISERSKMEGGGGIASTS